ncbi:MAG: IS110 family transposase, partial [Hyphomicrobiaceae bacterium]
MAAQRPEMRFVEPKSTAQQARAVLFRARDRLVRQRTELVNALRGVLYEHGFSFPKGVRHLGRIQAMLDDGENGLDPLTFDECQDLFGQIVETTTRIDAKTRKINDLAVQTNIARRLQSMPGVGPMTAMAIEAFAPPMETF